MDGDQVGVAARYAPLSSRCSHALANCQSRLSEPVQKTEGEKPDIMLVLNWTASIR
jgi:hypothetical protein